MNKLTAIMVVLVLSFFFNNLATVEAKPHHKGKATKAWLKSHSVAKPHKNKSKGKAVKAKKNKLRRPALPAAAIQVASSQNEAPLVEQKPVTPKVTCLRNPVVPENKLDITERICQAKRLLSKQSAEAGHCSKTVMVCRGKGKKQKCVEKKTQYFCRKSILIAAMDAKTGAIKTVSVDAQNGKSATPGYTVRQLTRDGVDSEYDVRVPPGQLVVGIQFPLQMRTAHGIVVERAIYTPYTRELRESYPELVTLGWKYLNDGMATAREKIDNAKVSLDDIHPRVAFALVMIEHFTNEELSNAAVEEEMYRVALTLGANGATAYKYSVSSTGARGIGQFMPNTWAALRGRYATLLCQEFFTGTASHPQAFIAQYLLAKEDLQFLLNQKVWRERGKEVENFLADPRQVGEYLALAYNGGAPRAYRWLRSSKTMDLPAEGEKYVRKFNQVWGVLQHLETE